MRTPQMNERGIALVVAVLALVVIGALVAGTFFIGRLEQQSGGSAVYATQANEAADAGLANALQVSQATYQGIDELEETTLEDRVTVGPSSRLRYTSHALRLNPSLFLVRSIGERIAPDGRVLATGEHAMLVRLAKASVGVNSAITVMQPIQLNGNAFVVNGTNVNPPGWDTDAGSWDRCPPVDPGISDDKVGIRSSASTGMGNQDSDNVFGYPVGAVANDPTITSATFRNFVDRTFATMTSQPGVKTLPLTTPYNGIAPSVTGMLCNTASPTNFGEPSRVTGTAVPACYDYYPVVNGTGAQTKFAAGSRGQGTLLINGDFEIAGNFEWTGLIIVRGSFKITGNGNKIIGAVLAESVTDDNMLGGNVDIHYSSCAIQKAVEGASVASPVRQRAWMQVY